MEFVERSARQVNCVSLEHANSTVRSVGASVAVSVETYKKTTTTVEPVAKSASMTPSVLLANVSSLAPRPSSPVEGLVWTHKPTSSTVESATAPVHPTKPVSQASVRPAPIVRSGQNVQEENPKTMDVLSLPTIEATPIP